MWQFGAWFDPTPGIGASLGATFGKTELLATLHHNHLENTVTFDNIQFEHKKKFVNGVGWEGDVFTRLADIAEPARVDAYRGWSWCFSQASDYLDDIIFNHLKDGEYLILNVVGFSRGGVTAMWFANYASQAYPGKVRKVNILCIDPVSGYAANDGTLHPLKFAFTDNMVVNQYVGIYAWDENSKQFDPIAPVGINNSLMFSLPGSHETLVGSMERVGHSTWGCCSLWAGDQPNCFWPKPHFVPELTYVSELNCLIASQLLRSPEWGGVEFDPNWDTSGGYNAPPSFDSFAEKFNEYANGFALPWDSPNDWLNFGYMRGVGFVPGLWPGGLDRGYPTYAERALFVPLDNPPDPAGNYYKIARPPDTTLAPPFPWWVTSETLIDKIQSMVGAGGIATVIPPPEVPEKDFSNIFFMSLSEGLNMVSLPLKPINSYTARSFAEELHSTVVIKLDEESQRFVGFTLDAPDDDDFAIEGGKGYIVNVPESKVVAFTGAAWTNQATVEAAPDVRGLNTQTTDGAWAFVVSGRLEDESTDSFKKDGYLVTVRNTRTNAVATDVVGSKYFAAVFANLNRQNVVQTGDRLELQVRNRTGEILSDTLSYTVTSEVIRQVFLPIILKNVEIPRQSLLLQNYPNPFNPETWIPYQIREPALVVIRIYDATGWLVRTLDLGQQAAGFYLGHTRAAYWDGHNDAGEKVASGIYFYQIQAGDFFAVRRMVILK